MFRRRNIGLRGRLILAFGLVAAGVALATSVLLTFTARTLIFESRQNVLLNEFSDSADAGIRRTPAAPQRRELGSLIELFPDGATLINQTTGAEVGNPVVGFVPDAVLESMAESSDAVTFRRITVNGQLLFVMGANSRAGVDTNGDQVNVLVVESLQDEAEQVAHLVGLSLAITALAVPLAAALGFVIGTRFTRPLKRMVSSVTDLGSGRTVTPQYTGYADVDAVLRALSETSKTLDDTIERLKEREQLSRQLVADVSHELRTPLTSMVAMADILEDTSAATDEEVRIAGEVTAKSTRHLSKLVGDLLEMSRVDAGEADLQLEPLDIALLLEEITDRGDGAGEVRIRAENNDPLTSDARRLRMILTNLLTNASRHGVPPVTVTSTSEDGWRVVRVVDEGPGISDQHVPHLFERFYRGSAARGRSTSSGLGLAIARENARLLGGDITVEPGATTVFALRLPETLPGPQES